MGTRDFGAAPGGSGETAILITSRARPLPGRASTRLIYTPVGRSTPDPRGSVTWVPPGRIVAYAVHAHEPRTFVFRTATGSRAELLTRLPGVAPQVVLLVQTATAARQALLLRFFRNLRRMGRDPATLSDLLFIKVNTVLARRSPCMAALDALLLQHDQPAL